MVTMANVGGASYLHANLLVHALLLVLDLLLELLQLRSIGRGTVGLEHLDVPASESAAVLHFRSC